ncbi:MAG: DUF2961 domain-containing protein [Clostridia bacterium]|nr:DUF2961 domain-containing protein [Clostridia bacterium]
MFTDNMSNLSRLINAKSRSVSAENFTGEKGKGGMATDGTGAANARDLGQGWKVSPSVNIPAGETFTLADIEGEGSIRHIWITENCWLNRSLILRIYWDGSDKPSVEVPFGDFFASADPYDFRQLTSAAVCVNPNRAFNCYWDMPFKKKFKITLENISPLQIMVFYQIDYVLTEQPSNIGYFHAQFRRTNPVQYKDVYTILDNVKGKGQYVGTYMLWGVHNNGWWGEGEVKFYLDGDSDFPTICGTGTEDYFCGSHNFEVGGKYAEYCTPYAGLSKVTRPDGVYNSQQRFNMYRWHIVDPIYFDSDIRVTVQALGIREDGRYLPLMDDISSVAFWYSDNLDDDYPALPDREFLEII